jgi:hypothetical protein|tara:strand:- start:2 stop:538 length:537 start_codon:yes stop_codon:yes gene_type:complete
MFNESRKETKNMTQAQLKYDSESSRKSFTHNKPVGIKNGEIYFLNDVFNYKDGMKGATGFSLRPLTQNEVDQRNTDEYYEDYYREIWQMEVQAESTEDGLSDWIENTIKPNEYDVEYAGHDSSYSEHYEEAKKHYDEEDVVCFEPGSSGRCFNEELLSSFEKVIDHSLIDLIRQYEKD